MKETILPIIICIVITAAVWGGIKTVSILQALGNPGITYSQEMSEEQVQTATVDWCENHLSTSFLINSGCEEIVK